MISQRISLLPSRIMEQTCSPSAGEGCTTSSKGTDPQPWVLHSKDFIVAGYQWLTPVIPTTQEAKIGEDRGSKPAG
jgi:hypothetical protein